LAGTEREALIPQGISLGIEVLRYACILFLEPLHTQQWTPLPIECRKRGAMQKGQRFRLTREAMAIAQRDSRNVAIMIPKGAVIEVIGGPFNGTRLMDVRYNDEMIMMFTDDMETHTEPMRVATA
jgi:hypothetical protein